MVKSISRDDSQMRHARTHSYFLENAKTEYAVNNYGKWVTQVYEPLIKGIMNI